MATLDELVVRIKADASQLERELKKASAATQQSASKMQTALAGARTQFAALVPAISVGALVAFGKSAVDAAGRIQDMADRIGFSAGTIAALEGPLADSGAGIEGLAQMVAILNDQLGNAAIGNQQAVQSFDKLGLSVAKLLSMNEEERFFAVADALGKIGDQAERTEKGRNLLGRGFAALNPTLTEANGNLAEHVARLKAASEALSPDTIKRIDDFGDALGRAGRTARDEFLEALAAILKVADAADAAARQMAKGVGEGGFVYAKTGTRPAQPKTDAQRRAERAAEMGSVAEARIVTGYTFDANGNLVAPGRGGAAAGSNRRLLKPEKGSSKTKELADDYDQLTGSVDEYVRTQQIEVDMLKLSARERAIQGPLIEAQNLALKENTLLTDEQIESVKALAAARYDAEAAHTQMQQAMRDSAETARELRNEFRDGLTDIILDFDGASASAENFFKTVASNLLKKKVTGPLSDALGDALDTSAIGKGITGFFGLSGARAGGGPVGGGNSYLVGERGPEIFTPGTAGYVTANDRLGGPSFHQQIVINPSVQGAMRAEIMNAIPGIVSATRSVIYDDASRGGAASRLFNKKS